MRPNSPARQTLTQAAFYRKRGNSCLSFLQNAFLYLSMRHDTSELYKRLGGTLNLVETFHCSAAPVLAGEASAQRAWRLGTAATALLGLQPVTASVTPQWPLSPGK